MAFQHSPLSGMHVIDRFNLDLNSPPPPPPPSLSTPTSILLPTLFLSCFFFSLPFLVHQFGPCRLLALKWHELYLFSVRFTNCTVFGHSYPSNLCHISPQAFSWIQSPCSNRLCVPGSTKRLEATWIGLSAWSDRNVSVKIRPYWDWRARGSVVDRIKWLLKWL